MEQCLNGEKMLSKERQNINISESLQLKKININEYPINNNNHYNNNNNTNIDSYPEALDIPNQINQEKLKQIQEKKKILNYIKDTEFTPDTNKYSNSILLGSFCYAIAFVSFGIFKSRIYSDEYTNVWSCFATYGGLGQITAGFLELNKKMEFTSFLYLIYGIYCLTHYFLRIFTDRFGEYDLCMFFLSFFLLSIPCIIFSIKINLIFVLQTAFGSLYFLLRGIGEGIPEDVLSEQVAGIIQIISGAGSFYIFMGQMFKVIKYKWFPTFPLDNNNQIDFNNEEKDEKTHQN